MALNDPEIARMLNLLIDEEDLVQSVRDGFQDPAELNEAGRAVLRKHGLDLYEESN